MFRSKFFWKLYSGYAVLVLFTTIVIGGLVHYQLQQSLLKRSENNLRKDLILFSDLTQPFFQTTPEEAQTRVEKLADGWPERITLILPDGTVLADSEKHPSTMDNHGNRPEILKARKGRKSVSRRFSDTVDHLSLYAASPVYIQSKLVGFLRLSVPLSVEKAELASMGRAVFLGAGVAVAISLLLSVFVARQIVLPINQIREVAESMRAGQYRKKVTRLPDDEIGLLGATFNDLGKELTNKISTLSHEEAKLRAILTNMVEGVIAIDMDDSILFWNRAASRLLEQQSNLLGRKLWQFTQFRSIRALADESKKLKAPLEEEMELNLDSGTITFNILASYFKSDASEGVLLVFNDISEIRRLERIRQDFVANVSHELKTPLTSIRGYIETLLNGALEDEKNNRRFLEKSLHHVSQLSNLVSDLLKLGELEAEGKRLTKTRVNLNSVAQEVFERYDPKSIGRSLRLSLELNPEDPFVLGDRKGMCHIFDNLLSNAIKYTPDNGEITLKVTSETDRGGVEVRDTGMGIPQDEISRIFERFYRVDKARSREMGGTGLGLAIVKHLVNHMDGEINVESELEVGSRFVVTFHKEG